MAATFLANQTPVKQMTAHGAGDHRPARPNGCAVQPHARGAAWISGGLAGRCIHRTAFAGATTGQQLLYALDEQVRRYEIRRGKVKKYEGWEFLSRGAG